MQCGTLQEEQWMDYITVLRHSFHIESCTVGGPVRHTEDGTILYAPGRRTKR
jgi:hypothetical protein